MPWCRRCMVQLDFKGSQVCFLGGCLKEVLAVSDITLTASLEFSGLCLPLYSPFLAALPAPCSLGHSFSGCLCPVIQMQCYPTSFSLFLVTQSQFSFLNSFFGNNPFLGQSLLISIAEALPWEWAGTIENPRGGRRSYKFSCVELCWLLLCLPAPSQFSIHLNHYFSSLLLTFQRFMFKGGLWIPSHLTCMTKLKKLSS